jgi:hypothetical protein
MIILEAMQCNTSEYANEFCSKEDIFWLRQKKILKMNLQKTIEQQKSKFG